MKLLRLDHVNVSTGDASRLAKWYEEYLGLKDGPRPNFGVKGNWLYLDDFPIVHLVETQSEIGRPEVPALEHFSLAATGLGAFLEKLDAGGIDYRLVDVTEADLVQVNLHDCDGNHIHIDFPLSEKS